MDYRCVSCGLVKTVTAKVSKPRAVCVCEPCVRDSMSADEVHARLNPQVTDS